MLTVVGLHEPVIPLVEVPGKINTVLPAQMLTLVPKLNTGVTFGLMVTVKVVVVAHCPAVGVNV